MKYLLIGLGNVGSTYTGTRHNIGFQILDQLAAQQQVSFHPGRLACVASLNYRRTTLHMVKPTTYMNHSGPAMHYWVHRLQVPLERTLVVVDDLSLPFGTLRIRPKGSSGGHNGLKSIETELGTSEYPRLRFGIGRSFAPGQQAGYVLAPFTPEEQHVLPAYIERSCTILLFWCAKGLVPTMNYYNT